MTRAADLITPMAVLAIWTMLVLLRTGLGRLIAVRRGRVPPGAFQVGESPEVPDDVRIVNRSYMNLLEAPVLFYVACLVAIASQTIAPSVVTLAWIYVGLRLAHSIIHLTYNHVLHRLATFALSNFVLVALWLGVLLRAHAA